MPLLSIITINLNNTNGLKKTIESVVSQTFRDFEYLIIDGASTDGSIDVIKSFEQKISNWVSEKDHGVYHAMNKGIAKANGEYCLFLNSGDYLADENILKRVFSNDFSEDILYGDMKVDWMNEKITNEKMPDKITLTHMFRDTIWHPVSFIRKELFDKYGNYDESYKMAGDYDFFFKTIIVNKVSTRHLFFPISVFVFNGLSAIPENEKLIKDERLRVYKTYLSDSEIEEENKKITDETTKKRKWYNRIKNKLKHFK